jgi:aldehyde:ferredoxin oxidoreductase
MAELFGWVGKILKVDLSSGNITTVPTSDYVPQFIGGRALAAKLYWDQVPPDCGAFDPENAVIFASGPVSGTLGPGARTAVATKSPETVPECYMFSVPGGHWSSELKFAGFDAVVVSGKAPEPVYIWIHDGEAEILKAERLWGLTTSQVDTEIRRLWGDKTRSMVIGPAGENLIRNAVILNDISHATGLGGFGAVMGSKNLKAIAVQGTGGVKVAKPQQLIDVYDEYVKVGGKYGGPYLISSEAYLPFHQARTIASAGAPEEIVPVITEDIDATFDYEDGQWGECLLSREEVMAETLRRKFEGCFACPACCGLSCQPLDPTGKEEAPFDLSLPTTVGAQCTNINRQTPWEMKAFGGRMLGRPALMWQVTNAELGINNVPLGSGYNWFEEAIKLGLLTEENTGLPCGDVAAYNTPAMIGKDGYAYGMTYKRNEFFERLAEGPERFLEDMAKESADWKTIYERYIYLPRYHLALSWGAGAKSSRDMIYEATQCRYHPNEVNQTFTGIGTPAAGKTLCGFMPLEDLPLAQQANRERFASLLGPKSFDLPGETPTFEDKVPATIFFQNVQVEVDSMPHCAWMWHPRFFTPWTPDRLGPPDIGVKLLAAITGIERTMEENWSAMEVAFTLERAIHVREGRRREHDYYTDAKFAASEWTTKEEFSKALDDYYTARGWDVDTAVPTRSQLEKLGMKDVADDLETKYGVSVPA